MKLHLCHDFLCHLTQRPGYCSPLPCLLRYATNDPLFITKTSVWLMILSWKAMRAIRTAFINRIVYMHVSTLDHSLTTISSTCCILQLVCDATVKRRDVGSGWRGTTIRRLSSIYHLMLSRHSSKQGTGIFSSSTVKDQWDFKCQ